MHAVAPIPSDVDAWTLCSPTGFAIGRWRPNEGEAFEAFTVTCVTPGDVRSLVFFASRAELRLVSDPGDPPHVAVVAPGFFLSRKHDDFAMAPDAKPTLYTTPLCAIRVVRGPLATLQLEACYVGPSPVEPGPNASHPMPRASRRQRRAERARVPRRGSDRAAFAELLGPFAALADAAGRSMN